VAYKGKFIKVQEVRGASNANGTGFAITLGPCPVLDKTNLGLPLPPPIPSPGNDMLLDL
jgi:hypothetical protein